MRMIAQGRRFGWVACTLILLVGYYFFRLRGSDDESNLSPGTLLRPPFDEGHYVVEEVVAERQCPDSKLKGEARPGRGKGRPIQFIHVPKAGGTSVQESLQKWAENQQIDVVLHDGDGPSWNSASARGLFLGHRGHGYSTRVVEKKPLTIVALREPVSRIISLFDYLRRTEDESVPTVVMIKKAWQKRSLDDVVDSYARAIRGDPSSVLPGGSASFSDRTLHRVLRAQVQFLCGYDCVWYMTGDSRETSSSSRFPNEIESVDRARLNLETIDCVAVLNRLDDLLVQLKLYLDFVPASVTSFPHENTVDPREKSQPSEQTLKLLHEWTKDEQDLFARAKVLAERKTKQAAECLSAGSSR